MTRARPRVAVLYNAPVLPAGPPRRGLRGRRRRRSRAAVAAALEATRLRRPRSWPRRRRSTGVLARLSDAGARRRLQPDRRASAASSAGATHVTGAARAARPALHGLARRGARGLPVEGAHQGPAPRLRPADRPVRRGRAGRAGPRVGRALAGHRQARRRGRAASGSTRGASSTDPSALADRVDRVRGQYGGAVLIEAYLPGPEFNVGVLALPEPEALCRSPRSSSRRMPATWPILTYAAKWDDGSAEDLASPVRCPAPIDDALADRLGRLAVAAFRGDRLPRLRPGRLPARRPGRADDPRGEPEPRPRPDGRLGPRGGCFGSRLCGDPQRARSPGARHVAVDAEAGRRRDRLPRFAAISH